MSYSDFIAGIGSGLLISSPFSSSQTYSIMLFGTSLVLIGISIAYERFYESEGVPLPE